MKQLFEEVYKVTKWCECCKHTYLAEKKETQQPVGMKKLFEGIGRIWAEQLIDIKIEPKDSQEDNDGDIEELHVNLSKELVESVGASTVIVEPEKSDDEWLDWESMYELCMNEYHVIRCPYIRKKGLEIHLDRDFIIPDDDKETLRILDKLSQCYTQECRFNNIEHFGVRTLDGMLRTALAKVDFALIEQGKDFGRLMHEMYFPYYERKSDITNCGYSWDLIRYYLEKYDIPLKSNDEYEAMSTSVVAPDFKNRVEYKDALADRKCDEQGKLCVSKAEYTRYAAKKYGIKVSFKKDWERFDRIFKDEKDRPIPFKHFVQSYRDQGL